MSHVGIEQVVSVNGKTYKLSRLDRGIARQFEQWARTQLPDPITAIKDSLKHLPLNLQEVAVKEAVKASRCSADFTSPEVQSLLHTLDGMIFATKLLLKKYHPDVTDDEAYDIAVAHGGNEDSFRAEAGAGQLPPVA